MAQLWDVTSGRKLRTFDVPPVVIMQLAVTPDGQRVVMGCWNDGTTRLWNITSGRELLKLQEPTGSVASVAITPYSQRLITGCANGTATVWDTANSRALFSLNGHTDLMTSIATTPDEKRIITGSVDGTVRLWDAANGREFLMLNGHTGPAWSVAVTPDGRRLVTGTENGTVKIWEAASREQVAAWTRQDQELARRRVAWQRPGAKAPGFIQDWLVLGPLALEDDQTVGKGLGHQQLAGESRLQPQAGDSVLVGKQERTWQAHHWEEPILDLNRLLGRLRINRIAYAACYVISAAERNDLLLQVGSSDLAKVYLNSQEIYKCSWERPFTALNPVGPVTLRKGTNVLVVKVVDWRPEWEVCARFVDREANPVQGLQVRLTPD
jgi:WD40 repeat protein